MYVEVAAADEFDELVLAVVAEVGGIRELRGHPAQAFLPRAVPGEVQLDAIGVARSPHGPDQHVLPFLGGEAAHHEDPERLVRLAFPRRAGPEALIHAVGDHVEARPVSMVAQLRRDERRRALDVGEAPVEPEAQQQVDQVRGGREPVQADVVRDVLGLDMECGDGRHAEPARDPFGGAAERPWLVDVHDVGTRDCRGEHVFDGLGEQRVLAVREAAGQWQHQFRQAEHLGPGCARVARSAACDNAHRVPSRDEGGREPHRRYGGAVVVDVERVSDQRNDHCRALNMWTSPTKRMISTLSNTYGRVNPYRDHGSVERCWAGR